MTNRVSYIVVLALVAFPASLEAQTVKVFILSGQSNMEGKGDPIHLDTYKNDPLIKPTYAGLKEGDAWEVRDDDWITYPSKSGGAKHGPFTVGYGTKGEQSIGPEFGFGHTVGNAIEEQIGASETRIENLVSEWQVTLPLYTEAQANGFAPECGETPRYSEPKKEST